MTKPGLFLIEARKDEEEEAPSTRVTHYHEFAKRLPRVDGDTQAGRCMNCGVPFCHTGCPLGNDIPRFNELAANGRHREALAVLHGTNNFPEFTGRICPAPCEAACVLNINDDPVTIETIEKELAELGWESGFVVPMVPSVDTGKKVAVVGSGPAGLACAQQLRRAGHQVVVFERSEYVGGLLRLGIPDFKLEKSVVERRVQQMRDEGVVFRTGLEVGKDLLLTELQRNFDAVVLAVGATVARDLGIPGRELDGVLFAMSFLTDQNRAVTRGAPSESAFSVHGKRVVILGGGDTGSDCVGTSLRQGALSVLQLELMPKPPETSVTPWPLWPLMLRTSSSQEEGGERGFATKTLRFVPDGNGKLAGLEVVDVQLANGTWTEVAGTTRTIEADVVLLAMGFEKPEATAWNHTALPLNARGLVDANEFMTTEPGLFACGDARRGQSLVVWAIWEGREAARKVDAYLEGDSRLLSSPLVAVPR